MGREHNCLYMILHLEEQFLVSKVYDLIIYIFP